MTTTENGNDASLSGFLTGWDERLQENEQLPVWMAVLVLTGFGERPVPSTRLAEVLGRPVSEVEERAQGHCTTARPAPDGDGLTRVGDGLITFIDPQRAQSAPRRQLQIGDRRFGMTGCAPDVFLYAPLVRPSLQVEETCAITGTPIRVAFSPGRVESVEPAGAVVPILPPQEFDRLEGMSPREADACMCAQCPCYSSAEAAQGWLAAHPGGRVFPVREAWDLSFHRAWRDRMSALLNLGN
jgi:alkylmercury lyase